LFFLKAIVMDRRIFLAGSGLSLAAAAWPRHVAAQTGRRRRVGVLMSTAETDPLEIRSLDAFRKGMTDLGWTEGKNLDIDVRWGAVNAERMTANAREIVALSPDVILAKGAANAAARQATTSIPIVFVSIPEAAVVSWVGDVARPTGNMTGFTTFERDLVGKRVALLRDLAPRTTRVLYVRSRQTGVDSRALYEHLVSEAGLVGIAVTDGSAENAAQIEDAMRTFGAGPGGGVIAAFDAFTVLHRKTLVALADELRLPAIYPGRNFGVEGGLCCYGFDQDDQFRQGASYVAKLLAGAKPADLPVQRPTKFDLIVNVKVARKLGLEIPPGMLAAADEIIE